MPHFRIEYSANLAPRFDVDQFCAAMHAAIFATGLFELGAIRVRAFKADSYAIADRLPENGFVDMTFKVGEGRSLDQLKAAGEQIVKAARQHLADFFATPHFALSFQIEEIEGKFSWKDNAIHARLRNS